MNVSFLVPETYAGLLFHQYFVPYKQALLQHSVLLRSRRSGQNYTRQPVMCYHYTVDEEVIFHLTKDQLLIFTDILSLVLIQSSAVVVKTSLVRVCCDFRSKYLEISVPRACQYIQAIWMACSPRITRIVTLYCAV